MQLAGNFTCRQPKDALMIHHGPEMQPRGARGSVAIILSKELVQGWKKGGQIIKRGGTTVRNTTRLL